MMVEYSRLQFWQSQLLHSNRLKVNKVQLGLDPARGGQRSCTTQ